jgi:adenylate cyclase
MEPSAGKPRRGSNAIVLAGIALAGFLFSFTPIAEGIDNNLLDVQWRLLRKLEMRPAADEVILVGVDEASLAMLPEPPPIWHEALGRALTRVASAKPKAIALDLALPDRSFDAVRSGLDQKLFEGLAAAARAGPFVAVLSIDPATRAARRIHTPFLAVLGEKRLGLGLSATDADGVARRFSLLVPTEDGGFPTLTGRLCGQLGRACDEGLIDYGLGEPILAVPLKNVLTMTDDALFARLFREKIVVFGQTQRFLDRVPVPYNLAAWETGGPDSPGALVHAQTMRTALARAPREASRPLLLFLATASALFWFAGGSRLMAVSLLVVAAGAFATSTLLLRAGHQVPLGAVLATLVLAWAARAYVDWRRPRLSDIRQRH